MKCTTFHPQRRTHRFAGPLLYLTAAIATAAPPSSIPEGEWRGSLAPASASAPTPTYVGLQGRQGTPGVFDLRFGPPYNCALALRMEAAGYSVSPRNGGRFCDALSGGTAQVSLSALSGSSLKLDIIAGDASPLSLTLDRAAGVVLPEAGRWQGGDPVPVALDYVTTPVRPGDLAGRLRFEAPRACAVELRYAGRVQQALAVWIVANDRGYCRQLSDRPAVLGVRGDGRAVLTVPGPGQPQTVVLERAH